MTLAILVALLMLIAIPSFRQRSFHEPDADLAAKVQSLNLYGRDQFWPITLESALKKPLLGWGPGSARVLVAGAFPWKGTSEYHPHNEYLQAFHDVGIIGLMLLVFAWIPLLVRNRKNWANAHGSGDLLRSKWNMAATLAVVVILITSITDNTMHYAFVTVPALIITSVAYYLEYVTHSKDSATRTPAGLSKHTRAEPCNT
jgi:O-antigen ligase